MNQQTLERKTNAIAPQDKQNIVPEVFRRQERFWEEIRKRIAERDPAARQTPSRAY